MKYAEHVLLFEMPIVALAIVVFALGFPAPLRAWRRSDRPRWRSAPVAVLHLMLGACGAVLWARWLLGLDLANRVDATFMSLLLLPSAVIALRMPLRSGRSSIEWCTQWCLRWGAGRWARARWMLDFASDLQGKVRLSGDDLLSVRGRTAERRLPRWAGFVGRHVGVLQRWLRGLPAHGMGPLRRALAHRLSASDRALATLLLAGPDHSADRHHGLVEVLLDRAAAYAECTLRLCPGGWSASASAGGTHPAAAILDVIVTLARGETGSRDAPALHDLYRALDVLLSCGKPAIDPSQPLDATLPSEAWLRRVLWLVRRGDGGAARLRRLQRLREAGRSSPMEQLSRFLIAYALLDPCRDASHRYIGWALEVAMGTPGRGEGRRREMVAALAWIREEALARLQLPAATRLPGERSLLRGMHAESMIRASNPGIWQSGPRGRGRS